MSLISGNGQAMDQNFVLGREYLKEGYYDKATYYFRRAENSASNQDNYRSRYLAYWGLAMVYAGDHTGLLMCRRAASHEHYDAEVHHALALAELRSNNRRRALASLEQGLKIHPENQGILQLCNTVNVRRRPIIPFLQRGNAINKYLGILRYRLFSQPFTAKRQPAFY